MSARLSPEEIKRALLTGPRISPSQPDTWPHTWVGDRAEGSKWTVRQLAKLKAEYQHALGVDSFLAKALVRKLKDPEAVEAWTMELSDGSIVDCPLLARTRDGRRILIITPGGDKMWRPAKW